MKRILIAIAAILIATAAFADDPHHDAEAVTSNNYTYNTEIVDLSVIPMAMAQHQFNYGTYAHQKSVSAATTGDSYAFSGAYAHRDCANCGLWSGSVGIGNINNSLYYGVGIGYTWGN